MTQTKQPNAREDKGHGRDNVGILKSRNDFSPSPPTKEESSQNKTNRLEKDSSAKKDADVPPLDEV